jgi:hypothetical protein
LGCFEIPHTCIIQQVFSPVKISLLNRRFCLISKLNNRRVIGTQCPYALKQRVVVRGNFPQLRIEVFQGDILLFKDFEEACEGRFGDPQLFGEALKLLSGEALRLCDDYMAARTELLGVQATEFPPA